MTLHVDVSVRVGDHELVVAFDAPAASVTAVLGPNGAGKTTLLRSIAGLVAIDRGVIALNGVVFDEPPRTFLRPERRRLGVVHQDGVLFPHLSALDNVAFGPRSRGAGRTASRLVAADWLRRVGVASRAQAGPEQLSGGEAQRVALARALATDPDALLLDEPLAAVDATARVEIRRDLRRHLRDFRGPTLFVTHDPVDALVLADTICILEGGRIAQTGSTQDVTTRPRSRYVADLVGTNLTYGTANATTITTESGATISIAEPATGAVCALIAPSAVALHTSVPEGSPRNRWPMTVQHVDAAGERVRVELAGPLRLVAEVTRAAADDLGLREGDAVWATVKATEVVTYLR